ncbi:MAG: hypothetical protein IPK07_16470 [Deltaproteobacteria bacterium]|nr:hypothetical protein [Deltaproteobacteria bacterium]
MPPYLLTARDSRGREVVRELDAASGDDAVAQLVREGLRDVHVESSELDAAIRSTFDPAELAFQRRSLSAETRLRIRRGGPDAAVAVVRSALLPPALMGVIAAPVMIYLRHPGAWRLDLFDGLLIVLGLVPLGLLVQASHRVRTAAAPYERLIGAVVWHRWGDVLAIVDDLERTAVGPRGVRLPAIEIAGRRAQALAGLGRMEEAEEALRPFQDDPNVPEWMYWHKMSLLHAATNDDERVLECMERAHAVDPRNVEYAIGLAQTLAAAEHADPARARSLVDDVRSRAPLRARHAISMVDGLVALAGGRHQDALADLDRARAEIASDMASNPLTEAVSLELYGRSALALARLGRCEEALQRLAAARPLFEAQGQTWLLDQIESATRRRDPVNQR